MRRRLSIVILPNFLSYLNSAKQTKAKQTLKTVEQAVDQFYLDAGQYPTRLKDLVNPPADEKLKKKWRQGGYFKTKELPQDPWDNNFQYKVNEANAEHPYELYSYGPKGKGSPKAEQISVWEK